MSSKIQLKNNHLLGETESVSQPSLPSYSYLDTFNGKIKVEWDEDIKTTPTGTFGFFVDFLKTTKVFDRWVDNCPLYYTSPNAPLKRNVLGTALLSILSGHTRYSHATSLMVDKVNPAFLGMSKVVSEDSLRRGIKRIDTEGGRSWQQNELIYTVSPIMEKDWILDVDTTIKTVFGKNIEGGDVSYNPHKPGRPSLSYHTYIIASLRLVLDVEVKSGNEHTVAHTRPQLWSLLERLPKENLPRLLRGDSAYGNENTMCWPEVNGVDFLFKLRQSTNVKRLISSFSCNEEWENAGKGWEGIESMLRLTGWTKSRRVVLIRRKIYVSNKKKNKDIPNLHSLLGFNIIIENDPEFEYAVLVTSLKNSIYEVAQLYRDRSDAENIFDELKNQWGWHGYTTADLKRCQIMARIIAQVYDWWTIFVRTADPDCHREANTTRPLMLSNVARKVETAGGKILKISMMKGREKLIPYFKNLCSFFHEIRQENLLFSRGDGAQVPNLGSILQLYFLLS